MNQGKLNFLYYFKCNNCQKEFHQTIAYSPFANLAETYCVNCANLKYFSLKSQNNISSLFSNSVQSVNEKFNSNRLFSQPNFKSEKTNNSNNQINKQIPKEVVQKPKPQPKSTPEDKRITGRTKQLNLKVKEKTYWKLKELALKNKCLMTEVLEKVLEGYEKLYKTRNSKSYEKSY